MSDADPAQVVKYDMALREWLRFRLVSERSNTDWVYYHLDLNEWRLGKYLLTIDELKNYCAGGYVLADIGADSQWLAAPTVHGEIVGLQTEERVGGESRPGYWIVLNLGEIEIVPGAKGRRPVSLSTNGFTD
jgi:hypothetical protein